MGNRNIPKTLSFSPEQLGALHEIATSRREKLQPWEQGPSWADLVREAVRDFVAKQPRKAPKKRKPAAKRGRRASR